MISGNGYCVKNVVVGKKEFNPLQEKDCKVTKCGTIEVDALWIQSDQTIKRSVHQGLFTKSISLHCYLFSR